MKKLVLLLSCALMSCGPGKNTKLINCEYAGGIIVDAFLSQEVSVYHYTILYNGEIFDEYIYPVEAVYKVGDTITGRCLVVK